MIPRFGVTFRGSCVRVPALAACIVVRPGYVKRGSARSCQLESLGNVVTAPVRCAVRASKAIVSRLPCGAHRAMVPISARRCALTRARCESQCLTHFFLFPRLETLALLLRRAIRPSRDSSSPTVPPERIALATSRGWRHDRLAKEATALWV